jgi:glucans biosynthesis protein
MKHDPMKRETREPECLRNARRCGAKTRGGHSCRRAASAGKVRCRLHGGAPGSGGPRGERNGNWKTGDYTAEALAEPAEVRGLLRSLLDKRTDT